MSDTPDGWMSREELKAATDIELSNREGALRVMALAAHDLHAANADLTRDLQQARDDFRTITRAVKDAMGYENWPAHDGPFAAFVAGQVADLARRLAEAERDRDGWMRACKSAADALASIGRTEPEETEEYDQCEKAERARRKARGGGA